MIDKLIYKFSLHVHLIGVPCSIQNYGSLDSGDLAKFMQEKDRSVFDATIMSEIDQTMKKHADNLLHVLEGVSARLTQLESRTRNLENSVDGLKVSVENNNGSTDGRMRQLENILREVCYQSILPFGGIMALFCMHEIRKMLCHC